MKPEYRVLRKLAEGGMAEVFVAEQRVAGKPPRQVALKRVLPRLRDDPAMTGMLEDEIALGYRCKHPNVIETLGRGQADGHPFVVLEYVDGLDLATLSRLLKAAGRRYSRGEAVHIAMKVTAGLRYLHGLKGDDGELLGVVHRDVTPPNILLGRDGAVKLCDFGFVRSRQQKTITEPGLVKGKFSYLSPEAARGERTEPQSDLFAVGIVLWEMMAMRRLFQGDNDYETVKMIQRADVPSMASAGADADEVLEQIAQRILARDIPDRFDTADALENGLAAYADFAELEADLGALVQWGCEQRDAQAKAQQAQQTQQGKATSGGPAAPGRAAARIP